MQKVNVTQTTLIVTAATTTLTGILGWYLYKKFWALPTKWISIGKVSKLCIFPLKSGRRIEVQQAECQRRGFKQVEDGENKVRLFDRCFVTYNEENCENRTGRHLPKLVLIKVEPKDMNSVTFNAPGMEPFTLKLPDMKTGKIVKTIHIRMETIKCIDCGDGISRWISKFILGEDSGLRLGYNDGTVGRPDAEKMYKTANIPYYKNGLKNEDAGLNSDYAPVFIVNQSSVDELAKTMDNANFDINCFRPNIVINGSNIKPFEEFKWKWIKVGDVVMKNVGECIRCIMTNVDMETGERKSMEPVNTLKMMSPHPDYPKTPIMGIYTKVLKTGLISLDDTVYVGK